MSESVFEEINGYGHVEIDSYETMCAVQKEIYEANPTKWAGNVQCVRTTDNPGYMLEMNPTDKSHGRQGFVAFFTDHLIKMQPYAMGVIVKMTADEYAAFQVQAGA